ncbi:MAG TPA: hypothetical protein VIF57_05165 [Polyangia bacterium]|jgi:hypothetical protein
MAARRCRIDIVTKDDGILPLRATGLGETIQAAQVAATIDGESTAHVVVRAATPPFLLDSSDESIRRLFPGAVVSLVHADVAGRSTISCAAAADRTRLAAAAAVATLKRCWGWDESPTIAISFEDDGRELRLDPVIEDGVWWVEIPG